MSSSASDVVSTTTGMLRRSSSALTSLSTSRPSLRGRFRSSSIRSGRGAPSYSPSRRRNAIACSPSFTTCSVLATLLCSKASVVSRTSPGSSSTSSTSMGRAPSFIAVSDGKGPVEGGAGVVLAALLAGQPDTAPVILDDLPAQCEPDAGAGVLVPRVQPLEDQEDPVGVPGLDADPVVGAGELPFVAVAADADGDP